MNRRGFFTAAASAAIAPKALVEATLPPLPAVMGFKVIDLALPLVREGPVLVKLTEHVYNNPLIAPAAFRQQLLDGLNEVFSKAYAEHDEGEWAKLFT